MDNSKENKRKPRKCKCGCGQWTYKGSDGGYRAYAKGCKRSTGGRSKEEWAKKFEDLKKNAPLCKCGCGQQVTPICKTLDVYIRNGYNGYPKYIKAHQTRPKEHFNVLDSWEKSIIIGTLLGDSSLLYPHGKAQNPRLVFNHGKPQEEWSKYKASKLKKLSINITERPNPGYGEIWIRGCSKCLPCLKEIHDLMYIENKKNITREVLDILNPEGIAWWYCDDGHYNKNTRDSFFRTEGFSDSEQEVIKAYFQDKYGKCSIYTNGERGHRYIRLSISATENMQKEISKYIPKSMQYKIREDLKS